MVYDSKLDSISIDSFAYLSNVTDSSNVSYAYLSACDLPDIVSSTLARNQKYDSDQTPSKKEINLLEMATLLTTTKTKTKKKYKPVSQKV